TRRRDFMKGLAFTMGAAFTNVPESFAKAKPKKKLKIGHTCITWRTFPPKPGSHDETLNVALKDISAEGFWNFETFTQDITDWDERNMLAPLIHQDRVPLLSAYTAVDVLNPANRKDE